MCALTLIVDTDKTASLTVYSLQIARSAFAALEAKVMAIAAIMILKRMMIPRVVDCVGTLGGLADRAMRTGSTQTFAYQAFTPG